MKSNVNEELREEQRAYIDGLKRYHEKGIPIIIDGKPSGEKDWYKIFEVREDGSFYMGDYVGIESGKLQEIRFDRVRLFEESPPFYRRQRRF